MRDHILKVLIALDQVLNALLGGEPDETISYRCAMMAARGNRVGCVVCKMLGWMQKGHCARTVAMLDTRRLLFTEALTKSQHQAQA